MIRYLIIPLFLCWLSLGVHAGDLKISMLVPEKNKGKVWNYLRDKLPANGAPFKKYNKKVTVTQEKLEVFYFDTPQFDCLQKKTGIAYFVKTSGIKVPVIREGVGIYYQEAGRLPDVFQVRHYNRLTTQEEKHPLVKRVKRSERELFHIAHKNLGINPMNLRGFLPVIKKQLKVDIEGHKQYPVSLILSSNNSKMYFVGLKMAVLTIHCRTHPIDPKVDLSIQNSNAMFYDLRDHLLKTFPAMTRIGDCEYVNIVNAFKEKFSFFEFLSKYPVVFNIAQALVYSFIGFFILFVFFRKRILPVKHNLDNSETCHLIE